MKKSNRILKIRQPLIKITIILSKSGWFSVIMGVRTVFGAWFPSAMEEEIFNG